MENKVALFFSCLVGFVLWASLFGRRTSLLAGGFGRHGAALCATIGVLGTFTGIFLGLLEFDVTRIDHSVPKLLAGLKIAFFTSILGMGAAVLLRIVETLPFFRPDQEPRSETTPETIHQTLHKIDDTLSQSAAKQAEALAELRKAISGEGESSLVTQMQKLRLSVEDGNRQLIAEFKQFSETMAEKNSDALIEALEKVVRDFNTQLNEQFGENFKQLNQAVGALLEWQKRYRTHIETMEKHIEESVTALQGSETAMNNISEHMSRIPEALTKLHELLDGFSSTATTLQGLMHNHHAATEDLRAHLDAVASLKEQVLEAFPTIEKNIAGLTEGFISTTQKALGEQAEAFAKLSQGYDELQQKGGETQEAFHSAMDVALENVRTQLSGALDTHTETINNSATEMQRRHQEFSRGLEDGVKRSLEIMSQQLASLSEKFVADYGPLTDKLKNLLDAIDQGTNRERR